MCAVHTQKYIVQINMGNLLERINLYQVSGLTWKKFALTYFKYVLLPASKS